MYFTVCFAVNEHQMTTYFSTYPFQRRNFQFNKIKTDKKEKSLNTEIAIILQWVQNLGGESRMWSMLALLAFSAKDDWALGESYSS